MPSTLRYGSVRAFLATPGKVGYMPGNRFYPSLQGCSCLAWDDLYFTASTKTVPEIRPLTLRPLTPELGGGGTPVEVAYAPAGPATVQGVHTKDPV
jgi:hypothetical protein